MRIWYGIEMDIVLMQGSSLSSSESTYWTFWGDLLQRGFQVNITKYPDFLHKISIIHINVQASTTMIQQNTFQWEINMTVWKLDEMALSSRTLNKTFSLTCLRFSLISKSVCARSRQTLDRWAQRWLTEEKEKILRQCMILLHAFKTLVTRSLSTYSTRALSQQSYFCMPQAFYH